MKSTTYTPPRNLAQLGADPRVDSIHTERDGYGDTAAQMSRPSYWVYLKSGYICGETECGTIHAKSVRACCEQMSSVVESK